MRKKKMSLRYVSILAIILTAALVVPCIVAYAKDCPGVASPWSYAKNTGFYTGCYTCRGTWRDSSDPTGYKKAEGKAGGESLRNSNPKLRGVQTKTITNADGSYEIQYYRCKNCGVCDEYSKLIATEYYNADGVWMETDGSWNDAADQWVGAGSGYVPWWYCTKCGAEATSPANVTSITHIHFADTVSFNTNGSPDSFDPIEVMYGQPYGTLPTPTWEGYVFEGWYNGGKQITSTTIQKQNKDHTLIAKWKANLPSPTPEPVATPTNTPTPTPTNTPTPTPTPVPNKYYVSMVSSPEGAGSLSGGGSYNAGDTVSISANPYQGYIFSGWSLSFNGTIADNKFTMPGENVTVTAKFITCTPTPTNTPTPAPTDVPTITVVFNPDGGTVSPTSKSVVYGEAYGELPVPEKSGYDFYAWKHVESNTVVTSNSSVLINREHTLTAVWIEQVVATPTPVPHESYELEREYIRYFTTDAGYTMEDIVSNTSYMLAAYTGADGSGTLYNSTYIKRGSSYRKGTDVKGNTWFFLADGTDATYVHPAVYNGYDANSEEVKNITELVFPSSITYNGTSYTVISIGGGTSKYHTYDVDEEDEDYSSSSGNATYFEYGIVSGWYLHEYWKYTSSSNKNCDTEISYSYGVLGNGCVISTGVQKTDYSDGEYQRRDYERSYYVYNTTLESITVPETVTTILPGAFEYCQALKEINGAENVTSVSYNAFRAVPLGYRTSWISEKVVNDGYTSYYYYYYNESISETTKTAIMSAFDISVKIAPYLSLCKFDNLKTIESSAFDNHNNLGKVVLGNTVSVIENYAFSQCALDSIEIVNGTATISSNPFTLGTKGTGENRTIIYTEPNSTAMDYGLKNKEYYRLYCGWPVIYEPNGAPGEAAVENTLLKELYKTMEVVEYVDESGAWNHKYYSAIDEDGNLWYSSDGTYAYQISPGTKFTEIILVGENLVYAYDTEGYLWASGQYSWSEVDSQGDVGSDYDSWFPWMKLIDPNDYELIYLQDTFALYAVDSAGKMTGMRVQRISTVYQINTFTVFSSLPFSITSMTMNIGSTYDNDYFHCIDENGVWWRALRGGEFSEYSTAKVWKNIIFTARGTSPGCAAGADGHLYLSDGTQLSSEACFGNATATRMFFGPLTHYVTYYTLRDDLDRLWLLQYHSQSKKSLTMIGGAGAELEDTALLYYSVYDHFYEGDTIYYKLFLRTDEKKLYSVRFMRQYGYGWNEYFYSPALEMSHVEKIIESGGIHYISGSNVFATCDGIAVIAADGKIYTAGVSDEEVDEDTYNYRLGYDDATWTLTDVSASRTYTDAIIKDTFTLALGTDGKVYLTGQAESDDDYGLNYTYNMGFGEVLVDSSVFEALEESAGNTMTFYIGYEFSDTIRDSNVIAELPGHTFVEWNTAADGSGTSFHPGESVTLNGPLTLYAQWKPDRQIVYMPNGGTGTMAPSLPESSDTKDIIVAANTFTPPTGKKFYYWNTIADQSGTWYKPGDIVYDVAGSFKLYAQWTPIQYKVQFGATEYEFGTDISASRWVSYGESFNIASRSDKKIRLYYDYNDDGMSTAPVMTGTTKTYDEAALSFLGWKLYKKIPGAYERVNTMLYTSGQTITNLTLVDGEVFTFFPDWNGTGSVTLPTLTCTGYTFKGWADTQYSTEGTTGTYTYSDTKTVYAVWQANTYTVTLDGQGATSLPQSSITMTFDAAGPNIELPTKNGYLFDGFYTEPGGAGDRYYNEVGQSTKTWLITDGTVTTLYANWVPVDYNMYLNPYYGYFLNADGSKDTAMKRIFVTYGTTDGADLSGMLPARVGYTFTGWWSETTGGIQVHDKNGYRTNEGTYFKDGMFIYPNGFTLFAGWEANKYTLTIKLNKKEGTGAVSVPCNKVTLTFDSANHNYNGTDHGDYLNGNLPTRKGYDFAGLYDAPAGGNMVYDSSGNIINDGTYFKDDVYVYPDDITLYAYWTPKQYTVTFDWNFDWDEPGIDTNTNWTGNTKTVTYDAAYGSLPNPTREGYEFMGWFFSEDAEGNGFGDAVGVLTPVTTPKDHTLHAQWSICYMESADVWLKSLRKEAAAVAEGELNQLQMREYGNTLLNMTVTTDGFFDYFQVNLPWRNPIKVDFEDGTYDKTNDIWYLPSDDYIQIFAAGEDPTAVRNKPGYTNENHLITVDFYKKDGTILITYKVNIIFIPYAVWKDNLIIGREETKK